MQPDSYYYVNVDVKLQKIYQPTPLLRSRLQTRYLKESRRNNVIPDSFVYIAIPTFTYTKAVKMASRLGSVIARRLSSVQGSSAVAGEHSGKLSTHAIVNNPFLNLE